MRRDEYHDREPATRRYAAAGLAVEAFGGQVIGTKKVRDGDGWILRTEYIPADCETCHTEPATAEVDGFNVCQGCTP
jgi:hypothetical protein